MTEFCIQFHTLTKQSLIGMVSVLGAQEEETEMHMTPYDKCGLSIIVSDFKIEFEKTYTTFIDEQIISINQTLAESICRYYESFGVFISTRPEGIYYDIPN